MYNNRTDTNQPAVIDAFRKLGYSVLLLNAVKGGAPDAIISKNGINIMVAIKTEKGKLNKKQINFINTWNSEIFIIKDIEDVIKLDRELLEPIKPNRERYETNISDSA